MTLGGKDDHIKSHPMDDKPSQECPLYTTVRGKFFFSFVYGRIVSYN